MRHIKSGVAAAFLAILYPSLAAASTNEFAECSRLLKYDELARTNDVAAQYALFENVSQDSSSSQSTGVSATIPIYGVPVRFGYDDARERFEAMARQTQLHWEYAQRSTFLSRFIPAARSAEYVQCVELFARQNHGMRIRVVDDDGITVHFHLTIGPAVATPNAIYTLTVSSNSLFAAPISRRVEAAGGERDIYVRRVNAIHRARVIARLSQGPTEIASVAMDEPAPVYVFDRTTYPWLSDSETLECGGGGFRQDTATTLMVLAAPPNGILIKDSQQCSWHEPDQSFHPGLGSGISCSTLANSQLEGRLTCNFTGNERVRVVGDIKVRVANFVFQINSPQNNGKPERPFVVAPPG